MDSNVKSIINKRTAAHFIADMTAYLFALAVTLLTWRHIPEAGGFAAITLLAFLGVQVYFWNKGHYARKKPFADELREIIKGLIFAFFMISLFGFVFGLSCATSDYMKLWLALLFFLPLCRTLASKLVERFNWKIPAVIFGAGRNAVEAAIALQSERHLGLEVRKFLTLEQKDVPEDGTIAVLGQEVPVEYAGVDPVAYVSSLGKPHLIVALKTGEAQKNMKLIEDINRKFPNFLLFPDLHGLPLYGMEVSHFFRKEVLMLRIHNNLSRRIPRILKRLFDFWGALVLMILLSPLFATIYILLALEGGSAFYGQERIGKNGRRFTCFKFRSMVKNADKVLRDILEADPEARAEWERDFKLKNDPRVTRLGKFLRESSLDELPQLWNVLRGEMSLVGPRPIVEGEIKYYDDDFSYYRQVRPGMTGLWQVSGRSDANYEKRVALDVWYVKNWALWYDVVILFQTVGVVLRKSGAY